MDKDNDNVKDCSDKSEPPSMRKMVEQTHQTPLSLHMNETMMTKSQYHQNLQQQQQQQQDRSRSRSRSRSWSRSQTPEDYYIEDAWGGAEREDDLLQHDNKRKKYREIRTLHPRRHRQRRFSLPQGENMGNPSWEERINAVENKYSVWQLIWVAAKLSCCVALAWLFASFIWSCLASWTATTSTTAAATRRQLDRRPDHLPHFQQEQRSITVYASTAVPLSVQGIVNQIQRQLGAPRHAWSLFRIDPSGNVAFTDSTKVPIPDTLEQFRSWVFVSYSLDEIVKYLHWMDMVSRRDSMVAIPQWKVHFQNALWNDWLAISTLQLKVCPEFSASTKNTNRWTIGVRDDDLRFDKVRQRFLDNAAAAARKKLPVLQRRQRHGASEKTIVAHSWERSLRYVEQMLQKANALTQNATGQWNEMREMMR